jgi:small GTP-binding protein
MNNLSIDFTIKSIMIGDSGVGKTTLSKKMTDELINYLECSTIGIDFYSVFTRINNKKVSLQIWDTAGNERFYHLVKLYFKNNAICFIVYDVCNPTSFDNIKKWINEFKNNSSNQNAIIVIVANKIDNINKRVITYLQGNDFAKLHNVLYIEVSSVASIGIQRLIEEPLEKLFELYDNKIITSSENFGIKNMKEERMRIKQHAKSCCSIL